MFLTCPQSETWPYRSASQSTCHFSLWQLSAIMFRLSATYSDTRRCSNQEPGVCALTCWNTFGQVDRHVCELDLILEPSCAYVVSRSLASTQAGTALGACADDCAGKSSQPIVFVMAGGPEEGVSAGANLRCYGPLPHSDHQECHQQPRWGPCLHPPELQFWTGL